MDLASGACATLARGARIPARVWPGLAAAAAGAGAAPAPQAALAVKCIPTSGGVFCFPEGPPTLPQTGGAVAQSWALGTLTEAVRPSTSEKCDLSHVCDVVVSSQGVKPGTGATIKREFVTKGDYVFPKDLPFVLDQVVDYTHPAANGAGGSCYPSTGTLAVSASKADTLVLEFQGQACQLGKTERQALLFSGAYTGDTASTGKFENAEAIGTFNIEGPSGLTVKGAFETAKVSFSGQLLLKDEPKP